MESKSDQKPNEGRIKHLELIQAVITKMANNSFLIKGWCVTLVAGLLALSAKESNHTLVFVAYLPLLMMWGDAPADFSMSTAGFEGQAQSWIRVMFSKTLLLFYGTMAVALLIATTVLRGWHAVVKNWF